ncbi:DUF1272 domain-containing protein [Tunturiibacter lichenicola]|uniref:DUF1272 domain-containing protein n=1 Tax=Tunturiibacter lichenicola TaxID=2051959 RepID=UPI003D9AC644
MALLMKPECERCNTALNANGEAFICSYECTFCSLCAQAMHTICPNCGGELVSRPRRKVRQNK